MTDERKRIVDEAGDLAAELDGLKAKADRLDGLKKTIRAWADDDGIAANAKVAYRGAKHVSTVSDRTAQRRFRSMRKLAKFLGKLFWDHCEFSVTLWDGLELPNKPADWLVKEQTGSRKVSFAPIAK